MKSVYDEFFYVPKEGKVREKVMLVRLTVSVILMIVCLAAMSISAYAYFACNVSSTYNVIQSTNFEAVVSIVSIVDDTDTPVTVITTDDRIHTAYLESGTTYTVTMRPTGTATTGFCVVSADGCDKVYHTQQLGMVGDRFVPEVSFTLKVSHSTKVGIFAHWGTSSFYDAYTNKGENDELYILDGETLELAITPATEPVTLPEDGDATTTTQPDATTATGAEDTTITGVGDTTTSAEDAATTAPSVTDPTESAVTAETVTGQTTTSAEETTDTTATETE